MKDNFVENFILFVKKKHQGFLYDEKKFQWARKIQIYSFTGNFIKIWKKKREKMKMEKI